MTVVELATLGTVVGVGFAIFVAAIGAAVAFGKLSQRVSQLEARIDGIDARLDRLEDAINELRAELRQTNAEIQQTNAEIQRTNRILVGLANHHHDTDGNTVFTIPEA